MKRYELLKATFPTQPQAFNWAWHVARTSRRHCRVTKHGSRWRVWRAAA